MSKTISISSTEQLNTVFRSASIVVANIFSTSLESSETLSAIFESFSNSLSESGKISFVKIDFDKNGDLARGHGVTKAPSFIIFRNGKVRDKVQSTNPVELQKFVGKIAQESVALEAGTDSGAASEWRGANVPRGYTDITDHVEIRDCEVLNADDEAGTVRTLFEFSKPSALNNGKSTAKDWVQSGSDDQLLLFIPFQATVKLHTIQLTSLPSSDDDGDVSRPHVLHIFTNRPQNMDFAEADDSEPTQVVNLGPSDWNEEGTANITLRFVKFQKTSTVIVYVQQGDGEADAVRLDRVRLIGEAGAKREMGNLQKIGDDE